MAYGGDAYDAAFGRVKRIPDRDSDSRKDSGIRNLESGIRNPQRRKVAGACGGKR